MILLPSIAYFILYTYIAYVVALCLLVVFLFVRVVRRNRARQLSRRRGWIRDTSRGQVLARRLSLGVSTVLCFLAVEVLLFLVLSPSVSLAGIAGKPFIDFFEPSRTLPMGARQFYFLWVTAGILTTCTIGAFACRHAESRNRADERS